MYQSPKSHIYSAMSLESVLLAAQAFISGIKPDNRPFTNLLVGAMRLDSRECKSGDIFIAMTGKNVDGHDFISKAIEQGASCIVVSTEWMSVSTDFMNTHPEIVFIATRDPVALMRAFAQGYRDFYNEVPFAAITGSCGKTTVKNLTAHILSQFTSTLVTAKSQNNHLGVPITLSRITPDIKIGVAELGANHIGEIIYGASLVKPLVSALTCVNAAHIEGFGSLENTAKAKGEILTSLQPGGVAVLNRDDHFFSYWKSILPTSCSCITFGTQENADVQFASDGDYCQIKFNQSMAQFGVPEVYLTQTLNIRLPLLGEHNKMNAAIAIAVVAALGYKLQPDWLPDFYAKLPDIFHSAVAEPGRLVPVSLANGSLLIDDSWNAVPEAAKESVLTLSKQKGPRWFVFGGMAELGEHSQLEHEAIGQIAAECKIDQFWAYSPDAAHAAESFAKLHAAPIACFETHEAMNAALTSAIQHSAPATILVKGSRSRKMEKVVSHLKEKIGVLPQESK